MPVVHVAEDDVLRLMLPVPEAYVGIIHNGEPVAVNVPVLNRSLTGKLTRFADRVQPSTRTMTAEVDIKNPKRDLIPGMYAQVQLTLADFPGAVTVPIAAVDQSGGASKVYVVDSAGIVHLRNVKSGIQSPQFVQILSGVEPNETVVVGSLSGLQDGERVQPHFESKTGD
jgi:RND family efflux transporter MFP subunit